jgi:phospholipase/lecithinase/hemolysin
MSRDKFLRYFLLTLFLINTVEVFAEEVDIYVIGDSLSDQGNLFSATETELGTGAPAIDHYSNGRFSDGLNFVDVIAEKMGVDLTASSSGGNNFAYGGARIDYNRVEDDTTKPFPFSLLGHQGLLQEDQYPWTLEAQRSAFVSREIDDSKGLYIIFLEQMT